MKDVHSIGLLIAAILLAVLLTTDRCNKSAGVATHTITDTLYFYDTQTYRVALPAAQPKISTRRLPLKTDSATQAQFFAANTADSTTLTADYYTAHYYAQPVNDSNLTGIIEDSVYRNRLTWTNFSYKLKKPVITITNTTIVKPAGIKRQLCFGVSGMYSTGVSFGPDLIYVDKKQRMFSAGYYIGTVRVYRVGVAINLF